MVRDLPVGKKIALGYGIQILLILLASVIAMVGMVNRSVALNRINDMAEFQNGIRTGLKLYSEARILAEDIALLGDEEAYAEFEELSDTVRLYLSEAQKITAGMESFMLEELKELEKDYQLWSSYIHTIQAYNPNGGDFGGYQEAVEDRRALAKHVYAQAVVISDTGEAEMDGLIASAIFGLRFSFVCSLLLAVVSVLAGCIVARKITRGITLPLERTSQLISRVGETGDLSLTPEEAEAVKKDSQRGDEVGTIIRAFRKMLKHLEETDQCMMRIAARDLTGDVVPLSPRDTMGNALKKMGDTLNRLLEKTNVSSQQVASNAGELAAGAESLSQNSSEQAAAVEELNASISHIATQARSSAESSLAAIRKGGQIREAALAGAGNMADMVQAMEEIGSTARSVQNIMKTIDNIAFQTNILSLNAAIEAARAGGDGRGFAEVARNVRDLALLSERAAKETGEILAAALERIESGMQTSREASASFAQITASVEQTVEAINGISEIITDQTSMLEQIEHGVDQIAHSIVQNSQTSEELAAASEEMSAQSQQLSALLDSFTLRGSHPLLNRNSKY